MKTGNIYLVTCITSGKSYVGMTTKPIEVRFSQHVYNANRGIQYPFYSAIRKHGERSFVLSLLEVVDIDKLGEAETKWISELQTMTFGYNLRPGGNGCIEMSNDTKQKLSNAFKGRPLEEETKQKISKSLSGRHLSQEVRDKIRHGLSRPECVERRRKLSTGKRHTRTALDKISKRSRERWTDDAYRNKMCESRKGSKNSRAMLDEEKVLEIRQSWASCDKSKRGNLTKFCDEKAEQYSVNPPVVFRVVMGYSWKHVVLEPDQVS